MRARYTSWAAALALLVCSTGAGWSSDHELPTGAKSVGVAEVVRASTLEPSDHQMTRDGTLYETWSGALEAGRRYRFEIATVEFVPYVWVQSAGAVDTRGALAATEGKTPDMRASRPMWKAVLFFTPPRDGKYQFVVNSMHAGKSGAYQLSFR